MFALGPGHYPLQGLLLFFTNAALLHITSTYMRRFSTTQYRLYTWYRRGKARVGTAGKAVCAVSFFLF